ncbi:hypothetical protein E3G68_005237 [Mycobacteroides abscessus]|nr:hypothetical protein [Mycobacteroides abscessus]
MKLLAAGVITATVLAAAALAVGIVTLTKLPHDASAAPAASEAASTQGSGDTKGADLALCTAIAPLMADNDQFSNAYVRLGDAGTPARDAATPKYITDTNDWIRRIQPVLDDHPDADRFLRRSLQRYIDDQRLVVIDLGPGPLSSYAKVLFSDATGAYTGPTSYCDKLGIKW